jgi:hypothetical protein
VWFLQIHVLPPIHFNISLLFAFPF